MTEYQSIFEEVKKGARKLTGISNDQVNFVLHNLAALAVENAPFLLAENERDLLKMDTEDPMYDRLLLTEERIAAIAGELVSVSALPSPLHHVLESKTLENGLSLEKVTVPLGVVGIIYEARPNVTFDVFSLALKSGNGLVLKGGSDADNSNRAIISLIHQVLELVKIRQT